MRPIEADWIRKRLLSRDAATVSPLANIGSQTLEFRTIKKPHIEERLFKPLREAGIEVVHIDIQDAVGVDIVGDLTDSDFVESLKQRGFKSVICSNLLEHLNDRQPIMQSLSEIVAPEGCLIVTVPRSYPYHPDPIDTMYRPSPEELASSFPEFTLREGEELVDGSLREEAFAGGVSLSVSYLVKAVLRSLFIFRPKVALAQIHRFVWLFKSFSVSCVLLDKNRVLSSDATAR